MSKKTIYCTVDTETVGGVANPDGMYNLGVVIHDKDGNIYATTSLLVMEWYDSLRTDGYGKKNFHIYQERVQNGEISAVASEGEALSIVRNLCRHYGVKYVMAYNSGFDFTKTICRELLNEFEFIDIYLMALQTITHQKSFSQFCHENNLKNRTGRSCSTTAETVYAFVSKNPNYVEEHTALSDALIEMEIFVKCYSLHKKFTRNTHQSNCWENKCYPRW